MSSAAGSAVRLGRPVSSAQVRELLVSLDTVIDMQRLTDQTRFLDAGADSLDFFSIISAIQDAYQITIPDSDLDQVGTITKLVQYLNTKLP
ncbi:MAG TPA: acyl carrier protein [Terriglobales bacterium]|nr:acyl carrier protein [Terriglobales bacterium]